MEKELNVWDVNSVLKYFKGSCIEITVNENPTEKEIKEVKAKIERSKEMKRIAKDIIEF